MYCETDKVLNRRVPFLIVRRGSDPVQEVFAFSSAHDSLCSLALLLSLYPSALLLSLYLSIYLLSCSLSIATSQVHPWVTQNGKNPLPPPVNQDKIMVTEQEVNNAFSSLSIYSVVSPLLGFQRACFRVFGLAHISCHHIR